MKKEDIYRIKAILQAIENDYSNDKDQMRADKVHRHIKEGVELCDSYTNRMKPSVGKKLKTN